MLWPDTPWLTGRVLPAVMPLCLAALIQFSRGFLGVDRASRIGRALHVYLFACVVAATLLVCWPMPLLFMPLSVSLIPSLILLLGYAVMKVRNGDSNARRFAIATSPLIATMVVSGLCAHHRFELRNGHGASR